jgi:hypothetical protein
MSRRPNNPNEATATALVRRPHFEEGRWGDPRSLSAEQLQYSLELTALWVQLRTDWSSLVLVPSEPGCSTSGLARALCEIGSRFSVHPIEFLEAREMDLESSSRLIARLGASGRIAGPAPDQSSESSAGWSLPIMKTIVALENPLANPLMVPISMAADGIVLCVRRGRDRLASVRDTIAAVGSHRIVCCVLLDDASAAKKNG